MIENDFVLTLVVSIPVFVLIGFTVYDVLRRSDLGALRKLGWLVIVVLLPAVGTLLYLLGRPFADPGQEVERGDDGAAALVDVLIRRERGEVDDVSFAAEKGEIFGLFGPG